MVHATKFKQIQIEESNRTNSNKKFIEGRIHSNTNLKQ